jgi:S-(hydroxymethyl)glutathione dehydrogenase/alcohol dehydrogenase
VRTGETAVVFGVGGVGLNVIQALRVARASRIIAIDTLAGKETFARQFGATDFINPRGTDVVAEVRSLLGAVPGAFGNGGGAGWVFDCVGHPAIVRDGLEMLDWGGNVVILGVPRADTELSALFTRMTTVDRGIMGCRYGSVRPHHDIPMIVELYRSGQFMLDELVSATYPLDGFETVLHDLHEGRLARGVLTF